VGRQRHWRRQLLILAVATGLMAGKVAGAAAADLELTGQAFEPGMTPCALGWGADDQAYPGKFVVNPRDGAEMVWVPAGKLRMGTGVEDIGRLWRENRWEEDWKEHTALEQPAHEVALTEGYWLYRHEVTNRQYGMFLLSTSHDGYLAWDTAKQHPLFPVVAIHWEDAAAYCRWAGGSLPTEAQWEWAARGPQSRTYPWGNSWDRAKANSAEFWAREPLLTTAAFKQWREAINVKQLPDVVPYLREVGSFPAGASWCGALDLVGNVCEWCADWYGYGYYSKSPAADPTGPTEGTARVLRGGSWMSTGPNCRSAYRLKGSPKTGYGYGGFRLVVSAK